MNKVLLFLVFASLGAFADGDMPQLNNGEKWIANEATHVGITNIDKLLEKAADTSHDVLVAGLDKEIQAIITGCSMKGEAHDQLHKVLHPIIEKVAALKNAGADQRGSVIEELKTWTKTYFTYFQAG